MAHGLNPKARRDGRAWFLCLLLKYSGLEITRWPTIFGFFSVWFVGVIGFLGFRGVDKVF